MDSESTSSIQDWSASRIGSYWRSNTDCQKYGKLTTEDSDAELDAGHYYEETSLDGRLVYDLNQNGWG